MEPVFFCPLSRRILMSEIVAYVGAANAAEALLPMFVGMELYSKYQSMGIAVNRKMRPYLRKGLTFGDLRDLLLRQKPSGTTGMGAVYHPTTNGNAQPHFSNDQSVAVVSVGTIKNCFAEKSNLISLGFTFESDTDSGSEVLANLIALHLTNGRDLFSSVAQTTDSLKGKFALAAMSISQPNIIAASHGRKLFASPMEVGTFVFSSPQMNFGKKFVDLGRYQICTIKGDRYFWVDKTP